MTLKNEQYACDYLLELKKSLCESSDEIKDIDDLIFEGENIKKHSER